MCHMYMYILYIYVCMYPATDRQRCPHFKEVILFSAMPPNHYTLLTKYYFPQMPSTTPSSLVSFHLICLSARRPFSLCGNRSRHPHHNLLSHTNNHPSCLSRYYYSKCGRTWFIVPKGCSMLSLYVLCHVIMGRSNQYHDLKVVSC